MREVVDVFLAAARRSDFDALVAVLSPDVVLRAANGAVRVDLSRKTRVAPAVARRMAKGRTQIALLALLNGDAEAVVATRGRFLMVLGFTIRDGKIVEIDTIAGSAACINST